MPDRPQPCQTAIMNRKLYYGFICVSETCRENEECLNYVKCFHNVEKNNPSLNLLFNRLPLA